MKSSGIRPDVITYNSLVNACVRGGFLPEALEFFAEMKASQLSPNVITYTSLLNALGKNGRLKEAMQLFQVGVQTVLFSLC